jgi:hypothetical protein
MYNNLTPNISHKGTENTKENKRFSIISEALNQKGSIGSEEFTNQAQNSMVFVYFVPL